MKTFLSFISNFIVCSFAFGNTFYVSEQGDDKNPGTSDLIPVQSISYAVTLLQHGDTLLLKGGQTHTGNIEMGQSITIMSYDTGRATIYGYIYLMDANDITIRDIIVKGPGYKLANMWISGIEISNYLAEAQYKNILVDNVEVFGFGSAGLMVSAWAERGFDSVKITNSIFHDNGLAGLWVNGPWSESLNLIKIVHRNVYVGHCKSYDNHGRPDYKDNWSGSGILVAATDSGLVEYCESYNNGKDNACTSAGPVGIWCDDSRNVIIQYSISHHNRGGTGKKDGGGFDIDGGSSNCIIQNCDSYDNEGAGYGLFNWETNNLWKDNIIRNCTSNFDGKNKQYGAFSFWGASSSYKVSNAKVYGNKATTDSGALLTFFGNSFSNIEIFNNEFCVSPPAVVYKDPLPAGINVYNNTNPCLILAIDTTKPVRPQPSKIVFSVYPNPSTGQLVVTAPGRYTLQVINPTGEVVTEGVIAEKAIITLPQAAGLYLVLLRNEYGIKYRQKIIKL